MRGKLRDKSSTTKRDMFKREVIDRKRSDKRDNRLATWLNQELEDQDYEPEEDGTEETLLNVSQPQSK